MKTKVSEQTYKELSTAQIQDHRMLVISEYHKGGFTIAQKVVVDENGKKTGVFLKNTIHLDNLEALLALKDAVDIAVQKAK